MSSDGNKVFNKEFLTIVTDGGWIFCMVDGLFCK